MIKLENYSLTDRERAELETLLAQRGMDLSLQDLYALMDGVWREYGCSASHYDEQKYARFYQHPIWLLNGIFIEQHAESLAHRRGIAEAVHSLNAERVLDYGGGFGTLARLITERSPNCQVDILDPYPPQHGIAVSQEIPAIRFISSAADQAYDALVCTDVLEHVHDPLIDLAQMARKIKVNGHLIIYNCFYPLIECHLPSTFHFRYSFDTFCSLLGLSKTGMTSGPHASIYKKRVEVAPNWTELREQEKFSIISHEMNQWRQQHPGASLLQQRLHLLRAFPSHFPLKIKRRALQLIRPSRG
jgi:ubiquinone/menaquinone biosynthesis C-methylase UbiE